MQGQGVGMRAMVQLDGTDGGTQTVEPVEQAADVVNLCGQFGHKNGALFDVDDVMAVAALETEKGAAVGVVTGAEAGALAVAP